MASDGSCRRWHKHQVHAPAAMKQETGSPRKPPPDGRPPIANSLPLVTGNEQTVGPVKAWLRTPTKRTLIDVGATPDMAGPRRVSMTTPGPSSRARWVAIGRTPPDRRDHTRPDGRRQRRAGDAGKPPARDAAVGAVSRDEGATPSGIRRNYHWKSPNDVATGDGGRYRRLFLPQAPSRISLRAAKTVEEAKLCWMLRWGGQAGTNYCDDAVTRRIVVWLAEVETARARAVSEEAKARQRREDFVVELT